MMRTVRALWLAGNAGAIASLVLAPPTTVTIVRIIADVVLAAAWVMVIGHAWRARRLGWACGMAVFPFAVWFYAFSQDDPQQVPVEKRPTQPLPAQPASLVRDEPLAVREARNVIKEAERQHPEW